MKTYKAVFRPDDNGWWFIDVPELPGTHSQARNIASGRDHIREAISMVTNSDLDTFDVDVEYDLPEAQKLEIARARRARDAAAEAAQATEAAVRVLQEDPARLVTRDVAELLGLSHQRVAQISRRPA
ncbi:MAG TPA: type II toxin-antitoxin system HicB family antitoxin [Acidimicrobiales bacterium]|nr:type II toxin-antitoxin system HicB family antitoxin [Acidimicrobiales bacterium]